MNPMAPMSPDASMDEIVDMIVAERAAWWEVGDRVNRDLAMFEPGVARKKRIREIATTAECSPMYVKQRCAAAAAFGTEYRKAYYPLARMRACIQAAARLGKKPHEVFDEAERKGLKNRDINALGQPVRRVLSLVAFCESCNGKLTFRLPKTAEVEGLQLRCPGCVGLAIKTGRVVKDLDELGAVA